MSVHAAERGEDKLDVQKKAEKLIAHTVHIMTNEKVFNPKYSDFHQRIVDCAVEIGLRPPGTTDDAYTGWKAHAAKGDSRLLLERCDKWFCSIGGVISEKAHVPTPDVMAPENEWWMFM